MCYVKTIWWQQLKEECGDCHMIAALADLYIRSRNIVRNFWISKSRTYFKFVVVWDLDTHTAFEANPSQTHERKGKHHSTKAKFSCHSSYLITIRVNQICRTKVIYSWCRIFKQGSQHPSSLRFLLLAATSSRVCISVCFLILYVYVFVYFLFFGKRGTGVRARKASLPFSITNCTATFRIKLA